MPRIRRVLLSSVPIATFVASALVTVPAHAAPAPVQFDGPSCGTLYEGEVDGCVTDLQITLNDLGFGLAVDGDFGPGTLGAVEWVQSKAHLTDASVAVDGVVGPVTKGKVRYFTNGYNVTLTAGNAICVLVLQPHPGSGTADAIIANDNNVGYCTGQLYRSGDGGRSWSAASGSHTVSPGQSVQTYNYSDSSSQLAMVCGDANDGGHDSGGCTVAF